jgi:hypothetical protein
LRSTSSRSTISPFFRVTTCALYFCGDHMP